MSNDDQIDASLYRFTETQDWCSANIDLWKTLFPLITTSNPIPRVLEIGSWEGRSAVFLLNHLCKDGGNITCVDHFDLFRTPAGQERFEKFSHNLSLTGKPFRVLKHFSVPALMKLLEEEIEASRVFSDKKSEKRQLGYDWVYIDGSHEADDTLLDGEMAWRLARKGAVFIFDDYHWDKEPEDSKHHPRRGIDAFLALHAGEYERLTDPSHYQVILRKRTEMRIGFLTENQMVEEIDETLGYGMHIALTVDSSYAIGAAVTMRSAVDNTSGRLTFYIVDCGLTDEDKEQLERSVTIRDDVTMKFLPLPEKALARELGSTWAKLDLDSLLPVERVLYLDADLLVRKSLRELWKTDLRGRAIAAASDVGYPMGHNGVERRSYFNGGMMLMDLAKVRAEGNSLRELGHRMKESRFRDQDALNTHFREWTPVSLKWNAQGLGTYAKYPSEDRDLLDLNDMTDPHIVHFIGALHPTLAAILNPYVQPPTAKPWGYLGAPSHPFQLEWWEVVARTSWKNARNSEMWKDGMNAAAQRVIQEAVKEFEKRVVFETGRALSL
ncbi:hypothetical protein D9758_006182 [Tetrapyrgos nigripes]|uniref:Glycosyltransferase family 8 protein n=1 Tax=Tetrapyrgos nigripes TaxID=182062 RepID=A0A8H5GB05_9AGAR|nr:hypothetical protein D9758_006182 [Tetrapyrgos nigripes]